MTFADAVKEARRRSGLSQAQAAAAIGWSRSKQAHIEAGRNTAKEHDRERIAQALGCTFMRDGEDAWNVQPLTSSG